MKALHLLGVLAIVSLPACISYEKETEPTVRSTTTTQERLVRRTPAQPVVHSRQTTYSAATVPATTTRATTTRAITSTPSTTTRVVAY